MPFVYKVDVLEALKSAGYSSYKIRKDNIFAQYTVSQLRAGKIVSWSVLDKICTLLDCQIGDLILHVNEDGESK